MFVVRRTPKWMKHTTCSIFILVLEKKIHILRNWINKSIGLQTLWLLSNVRLSVNNIALYTGNYLKFLKVFFLSLLIVNFRHLNIIPCVVLSCIYAKHAFKINSFRQQCIADFSYYWHERDIKNTTTYYQM